MTGAASNPPRVLIAGAAAGIGLACAEAFAARGAELILTDCDGIGLSQAAARLGALSRHCDAIGNCSVDILAEELRTSAGRIDVLINGAGRGYVRTLAMAQLTQAMLPLLRKGSGRRLVFNIPSTGPFANGDGIFPYASSLEGFQRLSSVLKEQTRGSGIEVITVVPKLRSGLGSARSPAGAGCRMQAVDLRGTAETILQITIAARPDWRQEPPLAVRHA